MATLKLIKKKECWKLTWFGRLLILLVVVFFSYLFITGISGFLSPNKPVNGKILVLDGFIPNYAVVEAIEIFKDGNYEQIITTGGDIDLGFYISEIKSMAELTRNNFIELNFDSTKITAIPTGNVKINRTFSSAVNLKTWLTNHEIKNSSIDVFAIGCHARRSKLLFNRALGDNYQVGVVSITDRTYHPKKWWKSSKGMRTIISETIAYFYSFLFLKV